MLISLSEIMNEKAAVKKMEVPIEFTDFRQHGRMYDFIDKKPVELILTNMGNRKVLISVKSRVVLEVPCDRCLVNTAVPINIDVKREIDFSKSMEELAAELDVAAYIKDHDLDMDMLINEEILLGMPMKVLCKEDCKGICRECGADLNVLECGCDRTVLDPRMSVIRDIFNKANL